MEKPRILLVEDDETFAKLLINKLKDRFEISEAFLSGEEAITAASNDSFDLIIMDVFLSGVYDGIDTINEINKINYIPFIFLTSFDDKDNTELIERMKEAHPFGYLKKSNNFSELIILIEFALYKHQAEMERKKQEIALKEKEYLFRNILKNTFFPIILIDENGRIAEWNDAAINTFHYAYDEAIGNSLESLIAPFEFRSDLKKAIDYYRTTGNGLFSNKIVEVDAMKKNGEIVPTEVSISRVSIDNRYYACLFIKDNTNRREVENELNKMIEDLQISRDIVEQNSAELVALTHKLSESEEQLKELNASKDKFFSIIAHDLKGPFQALLGYSELLNRDIEKLDKEDIASFAKDLHTSATQLFKLLENLLHWSRIQRGAIEYIPELFPLSDAVIMTADIINPIASKKNIKILINIDDDLPVFADINMINTVLRNLISNAVKFTPANGTIEITANKMENNKVLVSVIDNGVGIAENDMEKLFRIDAHHTTIGTANEVGTGLGLVLCKDLIEKNGGTISVDSQLGQGTKFSFTVNSSIEN